MGQEPVEDVLPPGGLVVDTLLAKPVTEQERRDFLQGIRSQTDKLEFLVQSMGKASRLETGAVTLEKKDVPLLDTLAQAMSGIVYGAEQKGISVEVQCPDDLRCLTTASGRRRPCSICWTTR